MFGDGGTFTCENRRQKIAQECRLSRWNRTEFKVCRLPTLAFGSHVGDQAHGVVEGLAEDLEVEVDGVAGEVAFGPASVAVFED